MFWQTGEAYGSLKCYFSSTTSGECEVEAVEKLEAEGYVIEQQAELQSALASKQKVIHVKFPFDLPFEAGIARWVRLCQTQIIKNKRLFKLYFFGSFCCAFMQLLG